MIDDLKMIKKYYGEEMMKFCRSSFPTLLDRPGLLSTLILKNFHPSRTLYEDLCLSEMKNGFQKFILDIIYSPETPIPETLKTPYELMDEAGYYLYECNSEEEIQKFRKYYKADEMLCTFKGGRLKTCTVYFAVKKNVDEIKRENFDNPDRQDEYGTSVISIQFSKFADNSLSIKNRYNHKVTNPDSTFSNNLDNIIEGLTYSFEKVGFKQKNISNFEIPGYVLANDGKYYKYNYEINNVYFCPNNVVIKDFELCKYEKEKYIVFDYFILDLINKRIIDKDDSFAKTIDYFIFEMQNKYGKENFRIEIANLENGKMIKLFSKNQEEKIEIIIDKNNRILKIYDNFTEKIGNSYLQYNQVLESIVATKLEKIDSHFLRKNKNLVNFNVPILSEIGYYFMQSNDSLEEFIAPSLKKIGGSFMSENRTLRHLNLPLVQKIGNYFLRLNKDLKAFSAPNLLSIGTDFMIFNTELEYLNLNSVKVIGEDFLKKNTKLSEVILPAVIYIDSNFLYDNQNINNFYAPKLEKVENRFLVNVLELSSLSLESLYSTGDLFLSNNKKLNNIYIPNLYEVGSEFLYNNIALQSFYAPNLTVIDRKNFMNKNEIIENVFLPNLDNTELYLLFSKKSNWNIIRQKTFVLNLKRA